MSEIKISFLDEISILMKGNEDLSELVSDVLKRRRFSTISKPVDTSSSTEPTRQEQIASCSSAPCSSMPPDEPQMSLPRMIENVSIRLNTVALSDIESSPLSNAYEDFADDEASSEGSGDVWLTIESDDDSKYPSSLDEDDDDESSSFDDSSQAGSLYEESLDSKTGNALLNEDCINKCKVNDLDQCGGESEDHNSLDIQASGIRVLNGKNKDYLEETNLHDFSKSKSGEKMVLTKSDDKDDLEKNSSDDSSKSKSDGEVESTRYENEDGLVETSPDDSCIYVSSSEMESNSSKNKEDLVETWSDDSCKYESSGEKESTKSENKDDLVDSSSNDSSTSESSSEMESNKSKNKEDLEETSSDDSSISESSGDIESTKSKNKDVHEETSSDDSSKSKSDGKVESTTNRIKDNFEETSSDDSSVSESSSEMESNKSKNKDLEETSSDDSSITESTNSKNKNGLVETSSDDSTISESSGEVESTKNRNKINHEETSSNDSSASESDDDDDMESKNSKNKDDLKETSSDDSSKSESDGEIKSSKSKNKDYIDGTSLGNSSKFEPDSDMESSKSKNKDEIEETSSDESSISESDGEMESTKIKNKYDLEETSSDDSSKSESISKIDSIGSENKGTSSDDSNTETDDEFKFIEIKTVIVNSSLENSNEFESDRENKLIETPKKEEIEETITDDSIINGYDDETESLESQSDIERTSSDSSNDSEIDEEKSLNIKSKSFVEENSSDDSSDIVSDGEPADALEIKERSNVIEKSTEEKDSSESESSNEYGESYTSESLNITDSSANSVYDSESTDSITEVSPGSLKRCGNRKFKTSRVKSREYQSKRHGLLSSSESSSDNLYIDTDYSPIQSDEDSLICMKSGKDKIIISKKSKICEIQALYIYSDFVEGQGNQQTFITELLDESSKESTSKEATQPNDSLPIANDSEKEEVEPYKLEVNEVRRPFQHQLKDRLNDRETDTSSSEDCEGASLLREALLIKNKFEKDELCGRVEPSKKLKAKEVSKRFQHQLKDQFNDVETDTSSSNSDEVTQLRDSLPIANDSEKEEVCGSAEPFKLMVKKVRKRFQHRVNDGKTDTSSSEEGEGASLSREALLGKNESETYKLCGTAEPNKLMVNEERKRFQLQLKEGETDTSSSEDGEGMTGTAGPYKKLMVNEVRKLFQHQLKDRLNDGETEGDEVSPKTIGDEAEIYHDSSSDDSSLGSEREFLSDRSSFYKKYSSISVELSSCSDLDSDKQGPHCCTYRKFKTD